MRFLRTVAIAVLMTAWASMASAHHGIINFDMNREVDVSGVVTRLAFVNPHSWLHVDVTGPDGRVTAWKCEGENPQYFQLFSPIGYGLGVNVLLHALTH